MAFNWQTFKTRTLTAAIFVVVMLAGLLINRWTFFILFSIIHFGCWWEYLKLVEKIRRTTFHKYFKLGLMLIGYGLMIWFCGPAYQINGYAFKEKFFLPVSIVGFILLVIGIFQKNKVEIRSFGTVAVGILYLSLSLGLLIDLYDYKIIESFQVFPYPDPLRTVEYGFNFPWIIPVFIIACMWINDTLAYIVGSLIGKTPLSKISPKKTWEGTIGGIIFCIIAIGFLFSNIQRDITLPGFHFSFTNEFWYMLAAIAALSGIFGDLLESKLKRMANVKDSGHIMPGHGGFLDRFDSLLVATPFVWLYVYFFIS